MRILLNSRRGRSSADILFLNADTADQVLSSHQSFSDYAPTPLHDLKHLTTYLGAGRIFVKDESFRFGLNAFKAPGGSYAITSQLAKRLQLTPAKLAYHKLVSSETSPPAYIQPHLA